VTGAPDAIVRLWDSADIHCKSDAAAGSSSGGVAVDGPASADSDGCEDDARSKQSIALSLWCLCDTPACLQMGLRALEVAECSTAALPPSSA
jgi:hypothetical protein